jgi:hypothetical protein
VFLADHSHSPLHKARRLPAGHAVLAWGEAKDTQVLTGLGKLRTRQTQLLLLALGVPCVADMTPAGSFVSECSGFPRHTENTADVPRVLSRPSRDDHSAAA